MTEWIAREAANWHVPVDRDALVDVLYQDDAAYTTVPAHCVAWDQLMNPVALWRLSSSKLRTR
jgi:hypothetical protein